MIHGLAEYIRDQSEALMLVCNLVTGGQISPDMLQIAEESHTSGH